MVGVQLIGRESVLTAYRKIDVEVWAIMQGKQLLTTGDDDNDLAEWLDMFAKSGSTAIYTLRCYDTDSMPDSITAATNYISSLNFKLIDHYEGAGVAGYNNKLMQRIEELEKKQAGDNEEEPDIMSAVMGWLNDPSKLQMAVGAFKMLFGGNPVAGQIPAPQGVAGFSGQQSTPEETFQRLSLVLDRLEKKDPDILLHLEKLADIAEKKPDTFNFLISNLNAF